MSGITLRFKEKKKNLSVTAIVSTSLVNQELRKQLLKAMELHTWGQGISNLPIDTIGLPTQGIVLPNRPDSCSLKFGPRDHHRFLSTDLPCGNF